MKNLAIIGGGPAALMLAAQIDTAVYKVTIYEKNKAVGRKFLVAGDGGLNLSYNASVHDLGDQFYPREFMSPVLEKFAADELMDWMNAIGVPTFVGSSSRVFPVLDMKPIEVLNKIVDYVISNKVEFQYGMTWTGWSEDGNLCFEGSDDVVCDIAVFAMGGASWKVTGSDGKWGSAFSERGVQILPFRAANCAFGVEWKKNLIDAHRGKPLKNVAVEYGGYISKGELVMTQFGIEGNAMYPLSRRMQDALHEEGSIVFLLDLKPTMSADQILTKYKKSKHLKVTDILSRDINLDRASIGLLKQFSDRETFLNPELLSELIKSVPIVVHSADDIDKAISTLGGIDLSEVDGDFQLKKMPNNYAIGEMLDWYAPTGGYLLQGCFSMGYVLADYLNSQ